MIRPLAFFALVLAGSASAQPVRQCATPAPTAIEKLQTADLVRQFRVARSEVERPGVERQRRADAVVIPIAVHVLATGPAPGDGNVPDSQIEAQIDVLNASFQPYGFQFVRALTTRTVNASWARRLTDGSSAERAMKRALSHDPARFLNLYVTDAASDFLGWATLPYGPSETDTYDGVVLDRETLPGGSFEPFNLGDTGTHEVGHWLGLYHTFNEDAPAGDACAGAGDEVDDTPVEALPARGCPTSRDSCPALPGLDPVTNFMDYSDDACMVEFTSGQATRMRALTASFRPTIAAGVAPLAAPATLAFGDVFVDRPVTRLVRIVNPSDAVLTVTDVASTSEAFTTSASSFTVEAGGAAEIAVVFEPGDAQSYAATLQITTDGAPFSVELAGEGRLAPDLEIVTPAVARALDPGARDAATVTIANAGLGELTYQFAGRSRASRLGVSAARRGEGGPDAFGMTWADSDEPGGPAFDWVDIAATGTEHAVGDEGSADVELGFAFPFYGASHARAFVSANGFLTFDGAPGDELFRNRTLPNAGVPSMIAPYWDDLDASGGRVLTETLGDGRFVATWDVPHYAESGDPGRFHVQAILSPDGTIVFQYLSIEPGSYVASSTVGIQPSDASDASAGLQVAFNRAYARDELAVRFAPRATWIASITPNAGVVAPDDDAAVTFALDASGLPPGAYQDLVRLTTNDPQRPETQVHVVLSVGGALAPPALVSPTYGARDVPARSLLGWLSAADASAYEVEVARDASFDELVFSDVVQSPTAVFVGPTETAFVWRVRSLDGAAASEWSLPLAFATGTDAGTIETRPLAFSLEDPYPNPASQAVRVPFTLREEGEVGLEVFDTIGRRVLEQSSRVTYRTELLNAVRLDVSSLPPGAYVVRLTAGEDRATRRIVVVR